MGKGEKNTAKYNQKLINDNNSKLVSQLGKTVQDKEDERMFKKFEKNAVNSIKFKIAQQHSKIIPEPENNAPD